jgi:putative ABC transport system substrate-binding protein
MRRREFLCLLGGAAAWPGAAQGQQKSPTIIGFLNSGSPEPMSDMLVAFRSGLATQGYIEGGNLTIEYRWAQDQYEKLRGLVSELVRGQVSLIAATGGPVSALAAKAETTAVPIVFTAVADPVQSGLVVSLNRPGGNLTGTAGLTTELDPKRLELLREVLPSVTRVGALINPNRPNVEAQLKDLLAAAQRLAVDLVVVRAGTEQQLEAVPENLRQHGIQAVLVTADPFFVSRRGTLLAMMSQASVPAVYQWRELALSGGLISYGPSIREAYREAAVYAGRILNGEKPADLPVLQPTKFELVINLKVARALGVEIPPILLARADEVIE